MFLYENGSYETEVCSTGDIVTYNSIQVAEDGRYVVCGEHGFALMQDGNILMQDDTLHARHDRRQHSPHQDSFIPILLDRVYRNEADSNFVTDCNTFFTKKLAIGGEK